QIDRNQARAEVERDPHASAYYDPTPDSTLLVRHVFLRRIQPIPVSRSRLLRQFQIAVHDRAIGQVFNLTRTDWKSVLRDCRIAQNDLAAVLTGLSPGRIP